MKDVLIFSGIGIMAILFVISLPNYETSTSDPNQKTVEIKKP